MEQPKNSVDTIDVFISRKSSDALAARQLYSYLVSKGISVFESDETLPRMGNSDYRKAIDAALDNCTHMIVVGSSVENIQSSWVEAEWGFYIAEKRADRKKGNILTIITGNLDIAELPPSLRNYEVILYDENSFEKILPYVSRDFVFAPGNYKKKRIFMRGLMGALAFFIIAAILIAIYISNNYQPIDISIFAKPDKSLKLYPAYPAFKGGELSVFIGNKEERKQLLSNGELILKQIPASFIGKKSAIKLHSKYWKTAEDSIIIEKTMNVPLVPDGSLSSIYGRVIDAVANPVIGARITIDTDTAVSSGADGIFSIKLPVHMQKESYQLIFTRKGYKIKDMTYLPESGKADAILMKE